MPKSHLVCAPWIGQQRLAHSDHIEFASGEHSTAPCRIGSFLCAWVEVKVFGHRQETAQMT